jgi:hypothetical protein
VSQEVVGKIWLAPGVSQCGREIANRQTRRGWSTFRIRDSSRWVEISSPAIFPSSSRISAADHAVPVPRLTVTLSPSGISPPVATAAKPAAASATWTKSRREERFPSRRRVWPAFSWAMISGRRWGLVSPGPTTLNRRTMAAGNPRRAARWRT